jgi:hypothetical protein
MATSSSSDITASVHGGHASPSSVHPMSLHRCAREFVSLFGFWWPCITLYPSSTLVSGGSWRFLAIHAGERPSSGGTWSSRGNGSQSLLSTRFVVLFYLLFVLITCVFVFYISGLFVVYFFSVFSIIVFGSFRSCI